MRRSSFVLHARALALVRGAFAGNVSTARAACVLACALGGAGQAMALDGISIALGRATGVTAVQGAMTWRAAPGDPRWQWLDWTGADLRLEATGSVWHGRGDDTVQSTLVGVGLQPLLRWSFASQGQGHTFVDFGVGPRLWSGTHLASNHRFGTAFEFGTVLGAGYRRDGSEFFIRVEHTSNGGIRQPNPGINFLFIGMGWTIGP